MFIYARVLIKTRYQSINHLITQSLLSVKSTSSEQKFGGFEKKKKAERKEKLLYVSQSY